MEKLRDEAEKKVNKIKNFNPYDLDSRSEDSNNSIEINNEKAINSRIDQIMRHERKSDSFIAAMRKANGEGNSISRKILFYKSVIKWLDIITSLLLISGVVISQIEQTHYYEVNLERRVMAITVVNCILENNFTSYNATEVDSIFNYTDYLSIIDVTDYTSVTFEMTIDDFSETCRDYILISNVISGIFLVISRYVEYIRNYIYRKKSDISFFKVSLLYILIFELILLCLIQYPGMNGYILKIELGSPLIYPISSLFAVISLLRAYFILKLFKHMTVWTNSVSEYICEKNICQANTSFAFKAFQRENPFFILFIIFIMSCYCLGLAVKTFELFYWENYSTDSGGYQNWNYQWNAMWFIFVSMTTVGYGDFYPKTQLGRLITLFACLFGVYFVSMMMVFLNSKTNPTEKEEKVLKLITRLKYRDLNRNLHSRIIYDYLMMLKFKRKVKNERKENKNLNIKWTYHKRLIVNNIQEVRDNLKHIKSCDFVPHREQIQDICEKLQSNVEFIRDEILLTKKINYTLWSFLEDQITIFKYLLKNYYSTQVFYEYIQSHQKFFKLIQTLPGLDKKDLIDMKKENLDVMNVIKIKRNQSLEFSSVESNEEKSLDDFEHDGLKINERSTVYICDNILNEKYNQKKIKNNFDFLFSRELIQPVRKDTNTKILIDRLNDYKTARKDWRKKSKNKLRNLEASD